MLPRWKRKPRWARARRELQEGTFSSISPRLISRLPTITTLPAEKSRRRIQGKRAWGEHPAWVTGLPTEADTDGQHPLGSQNLTAGCDRAGRARSRSRRLSAIAYGTLPAGATARLGLAECPAVGEAPGGATHPGYGWEAETGIDGYCGLLQRAVSPAILHRFRGTR